jgi:PAS domain S-box-containing protein
MRYVNDAFTEITGYDRADSLDRNCRFLQGEGTQDGPVSRLREAVESREAGTTELRNYRADGTEFWNRVTIAPIDDGEDPCFVGFQEDVTADREREAKIRAGEAKYRNLTDRITDAYYALDGEWRVTYWNDVVAERYGKPAPEVVGEVFWEAFPAVVDTEVEATIRSASETGEVTSCETYFEPLEGWVKLQVYPDEDGDGVAVISQDVTDLRDRESKLQDTQRRLELALDGTGTAAWEWDPVADEMTWTGGVERLLGLGTETYRGSFGSFLERIHPEDREEVTRLATTVDVDGTFEVECRIRHEGRDDIWTELRGQVVSDEDGAEHVVGTITDVTDRKEHERKLEESNERLEQFAYVASHDLQEPLRTVSNYVEILAEEYADELDDEAGEFVEVATTGCERMQSMINGLLDYSRVTTRGREFEPVDSEAAVEGIVEDLDLMLGEENGTVEWGDLPTVHADPDQLRQVFQNLVKNALEHGGEDPVDVRIRASDEGAAYHFEVEDDGAGIDPERQDDVFRIFNSGKQYQTSGQAKGIGLAICENIVQRHGGDIWVESTPGEGTTFHFTIEQ